MKKQYYITGWSALAMASMLLACAESEMLVGDCPTDDAGIIRIGGIQCAQAESSLGEYTTRANGDNTPGNTSVDAETVDWLLGPLFGGLDITYGAKGKPETEKVAILKLLKNNPDGDNTKENIKYSEFSTLTEKIAEYSFKYLGTDNDAKWYDNGEHYFQGVFVPEKLRYKSANDETKETVNGATGKAPNLMYDQSKDDKNYTDANYTLLERYLGMPADAMIHATVGRVKLPFRHRLARVKAYVLIDPTMGAAVTIDGYMKDAEGNTSTTEDATNSAIRFCNVEVLAGVEEKASSTSGHVELTPRWATARKVIPHFVEAGGSRNRLDELLDEDFLMFYNTEYKTYIFPTDEGGEKDWITAKNAWNSAYAQALGSGTTEEEKRKAADKADQTSGYKRTNYKKAPCYDLIVRPTYKTSDMVMYDEDLTVLDKNGLVTHENSIDFEITLNNGLEYYKPFTFDLDANYQNVVYLRINRESIDYNSSGANVWTEDTNYDGYYGVNNQNGNTLSMAGSSWQRAYRIGSTNPNVTDGHYYGQDDTTDDDNVQDDDNLPWYPQYVDQTKWVEMFAEAREGGLHHGDYFILDSDITIDAKALPDNFVFTGHLDGQDHIIKLTGMGEKVVDQAAWDEDNYVQAMSDDYSSSLYVKVDGAYVSYTMPTLYTKIHHDAVAATYYESFSDYNEGHKDDAGFTELTEEQFNALSQDQKIKTPAVPAYDEYVWADPQPTIAQMLSDEYYEKIGDDNYQMHKPTLYVNKPIHHDEISHTSGSTLFVGLNGAYTADVGEANVHSENGILVPYVDNDTHTGWRAEVINTKIAGADMFPIETIVDDKYDVTKVSGYIYNCWKKGNPDTKIMPHTPTLPKYK